jgi:hypothetical protein
VSNDVEGWHAVEAFSERKALLMCYITLCWLCCQFFPYLHTSRRVCSSGF